MPPAGRSFAIRNWLPIAAVTAFGVALQFAYLLLNATPQHWDPANHVMHAMRVAQAVGESQLRGLFDAVVRNYAYYPPGYYLSTAPAFWLFGYRISVGIAWQILYLAATLVLVYLLARRLTGRRWAALGALIYLCFPVVLGLGRMVYLENLLALQVALFVYLLLRDPDLASRGGVLALGLVAGWGQLTKWQFALYVGPLAVILLLSRARRPPAGMDAGTGKRIFSRLTVAIGAAALVAGPWYFMHAREILRDVHRNAYVQVLGNQPVFSPSSIFYYPQAFPAQLIGLPLSVALILGFVIALRRRSTPEARVIALGILASIVLISAAAHKQGRFIMPLLPLAAVLVANALARIPNPAGVVVTASVVLFSLANASAQTIDSSSLIPQLTVPIGFGRRGYVLRYGTPEWILRPITRERWALDEIFTAIRRRSAEEGVEPSVIWALKDDHHYYNANTLQSYVLPYLTWRPRKPDYANFWICRLEEGSFFADGAVQNSRRLETIGDWTLPDGSHVRLYRAHSTVSPLSVPLRLEFSDADQYFPGFNDAEQELRWSRGTIGAVEFPLAGGSPATRLEVILRLSALGRQPVTVRVNGSPVHAMTVGPDTADYSFEIAGAQLKPNAVNTLALLIPKAHAPSIADRRILGIALRRMQIVPASTSR